MPSPARIALRAQAEVTACATAHATPPSLSLLEWAAMDASAALRRQRRACGVDETAANPMDARPMTLRRRLAARTCPIPPALAGPRWTSSTRASNPQDSAAASDYEKSFGELHGTRTTPSCSSSSSGARPISVPSDTIAAGGRTHSDPGSPVDDPESWFPRRAASTLGFISGGAWSEDLDKQPVRGELRSPVSPLAMAPRPNLMAKPRPFRRLCGIELPPIYEQPFLKRTI